MYPFIYKYFNAERAESLLFILAGALAIAAALFFWIKTTDSFYRGMAYPLAAVALIQLTVGTTVYLRTPADIARAETYMSDTEKIAKVEIPRMEAVMANFELYRKIEIGLMIAGLLLFFFFKENLTVKGVGAGLFVQAGLMLILDLFAEARGTAYLNALKEWL